MRISHFFSLCGADQKSVYDNRFPSPSFKFASVVDLKEFLYTTAMNEMNNSSLARIPQVIENLKDSLVQVYHPREIFLFGSCAWGIPDSDSDIDIAVILDSSDISMVERMRLATDILWSAGVPVDLLVFTRDEIELKAQWKSTLQYKILHEGKKIYETS